MIPLSFKSSKHAGYIHLMYKEIVILNSQQKCHCIIIDKFIELPATAEALPFEPKKEREKAQINNYFIQSTTTN